MDKRQLSYYEAITTHGRDANPFFRLMGVEILHFGAGEAALQMLIRPDMRNGEGWLQGGLLVALADEAMALALYTVLDATDRIATVSENTHFLRGARDGTVTAIGRVTRRHTGVAFTEGEVRSGSATEGLLTRTAAVFSVLTAS